MKRTDPLPALLRAFFDEWLVEERNGFGPYGPILPRHLALVPEVRCPAPSAYGGSTPPGRPYRF